MIWYLNSIETPTIPKPDTTPQQPAKPEREPVPGNPLPKPPHKPAVEPTRN